MSSIPIDDIKKIALLARIELSGEEGTQVSSDVSTVLGHFSELKAIDTVGVHAAEDASGLSNVDRTDTENASALATSSEIIKNVPHTNNGYVQVPGVFSETETV